MALRDVVDPEFDGQPPREPGTCLTGRCDGSAWVRVSDAYIDRYAGPPPSIPQGETELEQAEFNAAHFWYRVRRAGFRQTVFPCPSCSPRQFERWSGGHWAWDHDRAGCVDCRRVDAETGRRTPKARAKKEPEQVAPAAVIAPPEPEPEPPPTTEPML